MQLQQWTKINGTIIHQPIEDEVRQALLKERGAGHIVKVCIGTDSQVKGSKITFATVVVLVRKGKGAFMYIHTETTKRTMTVKERMLDEVSRSVNIAYSLCKLFIAFDIHMEVHADINTNPNFKSNTALKDAMGYIMGMGYVFKAKPNAFAGSCCADRMVH
jgi:uncharacterized protein